MRSKNDLFIQKSVHLPKKCCEKPLLYFYKESLKKKQNRMYEQIVGRGHFNNHYTSKSDEKLNFTSPAKSHFF